MVTSFRYASQPGSHRRRESLTPRSTSAAPVPRACSIRIGRRTGGTAGSEDGRCKVNMGSVISNLATARDLANKDGLLLAGANRSPAGRPWAGLSQRDPFGGGPYITPCVHSATPCGSSSPCHTAQRNCPAPAAGPLGRPRKYSGAPIACRTQRGEGSPSITSRTRHHRSGCKGPLSWFGTGAEGVNSGLSRHGSSEPEPGPENTSASRGEPGRDAILQIGRG